MEINTTIWGDDTQRHTFNSDDTPSRGLCKYSTVVSTLRDYSTAHSMSDPIDESVNLWQVGDNSDINSCLYLRRDGNDNLIQDICRAPMAHSIMLVAPGYNMSNNSKFNLNSGVNSVCQIWSGDSICNFPYKSGANRNDYIVTDFDYNQIAARFQLFVQKHDSSNNRVGSESQISIYQYWFDTDGNGDSYKDNYYINAMTMQLCVGSKTERYTSFGGSYNYPPVIVCNSQYATPMPNYYYNDSYFYSYTLSNTGGNIFFGLRQISYNTPYQQGAYSTSNNAFGGTFWGSNWVLDDYYIGTSHYLSGHFTGSYEDMLKQCAYLGFWFDETQLPNTGGTFTIGENCTSDHVILPEIISGRTTGNYKRGSAAGADPQAQWGSDWRDSVGYNGGQPYKPADNQNTGDLTTIFNRPVIGGSCNYYNAIGTDVLNLTGFINSGYQPANEDQFIVDFKGVNPADYISSILYYPTGFTAGKLTESGTPVEIAIGALSTTGVYMIPADAGSQNIVSFSPLPLQQYYHDFRDYAPYTSLDLYIPFCGAVELDPAIYLGHTLQVYLFIDFPTGNCTAAIMCDGLVHDTISGSCGVSVPLTAANIGSYQNAIKSAEIALKQAEMQRKSAWIGLAASTGTLLAGAATGNALMIAGAGAGVLSSALNIGKADLNVRAAEYQLDHIAPSIRSVSAASPANALCLDYDCHLLIKRPFEVPVNDSVYSETIGNACCITDVLSAFHGLTICNSVYISDIISDYISIDDNTYGGNAATAQEMALIQQSLANGVYLP